jgi:hypothetical protein
MVNVVTVLLQDVAQVEKSNKLHSVGEEDARHRALVFAVVEGVRFGWNLYQASRQGKVTGVPPPVGLVV